MNKSGFSRLVAAFMPMLAGVPVTAFAQPAQDLKQAPSIWDEGFGQGFRSGTESVNMSLGVNYGVPMLGGRESHHLALTSVSYSRMAGRVRNKRHWYRGNWEIRAEIFGGAEFSPEKEWVVGLTPHLRYNFATGTRWMPFIDIGAGVTATSIGPPDLGGIFEFNLQGCVGTHWFFQENMALTFEGRYLHLSCAGISDPNLGLNGAAGFVGLSFFW